jgi:hypothetical protein
MAIPDIVDLLQDFLTTQLAAPPPARSVATRVPDPRPDEWLQIRRVGGAKAPPVTDKARIDLIAWALSEPAAMALLLRARVLVGGLAVPGGNLGNVPVYRVEETLGPKQADDPATGALQAWMTVAITYRADDLIR